MAVEKSQIKFAKSSETGEIIGFVSRHPKTKKLNGVFEDSPYGKKICVLAEDLKGKVEPGLPYSVELKVMRNGNGYVVVSAVLATFKAEIKITIVTKAVYQVCVVFGNKTVYYDPKDGKTENSRTVSGVLKVLKQRRDIKDIDQVIEDFMAAANELKEQMKADGYYST